LSANTRSQASLQRGLPSKSAAAEAANNTKLFCVTAIKRNKFIFCSSKRLQKYGLNALTKMTKMMQQSCLMVEWWNGENAAVDDIHLQ
jgi:hypothetical protein